MLHVGQVEQVDADVIDLLQPHPRVERDRRQDGDLGGGIGAGHVLGGVGLRVAQRLRLGQRLGVGSAALDHARQDEVGGAVDDAVDPVHVGHDHRLAQHLHDRDRGADAGLEPQLHAVSLGRAEQLVAVLGQQLLVRRHHRLTGSEQRQHVLTRGLDAAHHLGHDADGGIVAQPCEVGREHALRRVGVAGGIAHQRRGHLDRLAGDALDRLGALPQQPVHGGADGAVSEQSDPDG